MKKITRKLLVIMVITCFAFTGCKKNPGADFSRSTTAGGPFNNVPELIIEGNITQNMTLSPGTIYKLKGIVFVTGGAKLTIQPGTIITTGGTVNYRVSPSSGGLISVPGTLVITKGSSIDAVGTPEQPIVFTTPKAAGARVPGDIGGIIILGRSITNRPSSTIVEGLPGYDANGNSLGVDITYGGSDPADNSGKIEYVRVDYPGFRLAQDNGINGLTLAGVGTGTTVDHVQVSFSATDAFGFSGGTVNAAYLFALSSEDDDFDMSYGYRGEIKYAIGLKDPSTWHSQTAAGANDSNGIESDNDGVASTALPRTKPFCSNFTLLGYSTQGATLSVGTRWRRYTDLSMQNSIIAGYNAGAEFISGTESTATEGVFTNNAVHGYNLVFNTANAISLSHSINSTSSDANPDAFVALGVGGRSPFYTTAGAPSFSMNNIRPRISTSTVGAILASNFANWNSGWLSFIPQTRID